MLKNLSLSVKYQYLIFGIPLLLLYLCLYACNGSDYNEELSGNYFYTDEGDNAKDIINHLPNRKGIYAKVTAYDYNTDFIVAVQQPDYEKHKSMIAYKLRNDLKKYAANSSADRLESEQEADSILRHDPYYKLIFAHQKNYWIIENKHKLLIGPLTQNEYKTKRKELEIPENIEIN